MRVLAKYLLAAPCVWSALAHPTLAGEAGRGPEASRHGHPMAASVKIVLSPRMPFALKEWPRMKAVAESAGYQVVGLRDPRVPDAEWAAAVEAVGAPELMHLPKIDEAYAVRLGVLNHAPASLLTCMGKTHPWPILGVMPDLAWLAVLRARASQLECTG